MLRTWANAFVKPDTVLCPKFALIIKDNPKPTIAIATKVNNKCTINFFFLTQLPQTLCSTISYNEIYSIIISLEMRKIWKHY